jgi:uncharacterized membrane protein YhaH (DUF805 family)
MKRIRWPWIAGLAEGFAIMAFLYVWLIIVAIVLALFSPNVSNPSAFEFSAIVFLGVLLLWITLYLTMKRIEEMEKNADKV